MFQSCCQKDYVNSTFFVFTILSLEKKPLTISFLLINHWQLPEESLTINQLKKKNKRQILISFKMVFFFKVESFITFFFLLRESFNEF